ncbi:MAG: hypothetical protein OWU84_05215 [Firmicutes bacterium]|nr:hypothetical protein [Bacillota bacterium]
MGFGPKAPDVESGVQAVKDLIALLYPERATPKVLHLVGESARLILEAKAALTFENIARVWRDPEWRQWLLGRTSSEATAAFWNPYGSQALDPAALDSDFGWLIADRLKATQEFWNGAETGDPDD